MMNQQDYAYYGAYAPILEQAETFVLHQLEQVLHSISQDTEHAPAEHIRSRIKSAESMREKLRGRGLKPDAASAIQMLSDAVGVRVVTHFVGDVYTVLKQIQASSCWEVVRIKDYIAAPKPNGYRSLHVILQIPTGNEEIPQIRAEIQLRTIAMDCWASLEHQMKYKKHIENAELIAEELRRCADEMASTDLTMQTIREMICGEQ